MPLRSLAPFPLATNLPLNQLGFASAALLAPPHSKPTHLGWVVQMKPTRAVRSVRLGGLGETKTKKKNVETGMFPNEMLQK